MAKYHMRKNEREITDQNELMEILKKGKLAAISMCRESEPYIVVLNYGYDKAKNSLYFHCAKSGLKIDFIKDNKRVCGTIIEDLGYIMDECEQKYRSLVFWGEMFFIENLEEKKHGIDVLINHLEKNLKEVKEKSIKSEETYEDVGILRLDIKELTGKKKI
ncbi:MAG TPA: pyridoxamine 5'-phosphate oxidase family protein [Terriglobales bacterium]|nr:pyridoxamine 5'-phosphate oxidase family protein [Terriglobales bacterium]